MKRLVSLLLLLCLLLSLGACGEAAAPSTAAPTETEATEPSTAPTEVEEEKEYPELGYAKGGVYYNEAFHFTFAMDYGWTSYNETTRLSSSGMKTDENGEKITSVAQLLEAGGTACAFWAQLHDKAYFIVKVAKNSAPASSYLSEEAIERIAQGALTSLDNCESSQYSLVKQDVGGVSVEVIRVEVLIDGSREYYDRLYLFCEGYVAIIDLHARSTELLDSVWTQFSLTTRGTSTAED